MRNMSVNNFMSLDGVMQAPSDADATSGGFDRGGWNMPYLDVSMRWLVASVTSVGGYHLGHHGHHNLAAHWPNRGEDEQALAGSDFVDGDSLVQV
jgi:hypothetical protein